MKKFRTILYLLLVYGFLFSFSYAQSLSTLPNSIQFTVTPETPGPNEPVRIDMQGISSLLETATITWRVNGKTVSSGIGNTSLYFVTGYLGSKSTVHVSVTSAEGVFSQDFVFIPSVINLVWEADTTVPPLYKGKALYSAGSVIRVVAFPEILQGRSLVSANTLSFQWSLNQTLVPEQSGVGKTVFTFQGDQLKSDENVSVDIFSGNSKIGHGAITINAVKPQLELYTLDPLRGEIIDTALFSPYILQKNEVSVVAEPYFFSTTGNFAYTWSLNGSGVSGPDTQKGILTLRQTGQSAGSAFIDVQLQNTASDQLVQAGTASLQIILGSIRTPLLGI